MYVFYSKINSIPKDQLILKGLFGVFNSSKKRMKNFCPSSLGQKSKLSSSFFGRIEDTKESFRNLLTFKGQLISECLLGV